MKDDEVARTFEEWYSKDPHEIDVLPGDTIDEAMQRPAWEAGKIAGAALMRERTAVLADVPRLECYCEIGMPNCLPCIARAIRSLPLDTEVASSA